MEGTARDTDSLILVLRRQPQPCGAFQLCSGSATLLVSAQLEKLASAQHIFPEPKPHESCSQRDVTTSQRQTHCQILGPGTERLDNSADGENGNFSESAGQRGLPGSSEEGPERLYLETGNIYYLWGVI